MLCAIDEDFIVKRLEDRLQGVFKSMLQYVDIHRDKQVLKALIAEVSGIAFTAKLQGIQSRSRTKKLLNRMYITTWRNTKQFELRHR